MCHICFETSVAQKHGKQIQNGALTPAHYRLWAELSDWKRIAERAVPFLSPEDKFTQPEGFRSGVEHVGCEMAVLPAVFLPSRRLDGIAVHHRQLPIQAFAVD